MELLAVVIENKNVSESQYNKALKIVKYYEDSLEKQNLIKSKADELNTYQLEKFTTNETTELPTKQKRRNGVKKVEIEVEEFISESEIAEIKVRKPDVIDPKKIVPTLGANGNVTHFNLHLTFSPQVIKCLEAYFLQFKGIEINPYQVSKKEFLGMNIFKFNRVTNFKTSYVITLVKFLIANDIRCTHKVENNRLVSLGYN